MSALRTSASCLPETPGVSGSATTREGGHLRAAQGTSLIPTGHPGADPHRALPGPGRMRRGDTGPYRESGLKRTSSACSSPTLARRQRCSRAAKSRVLHSRTVRSSAHDARNWPLLLKSRQETEPLWPCGERTVAARRQSGGRRRDTGAHRYLEGGDQQPVGEAVLLRLVPPGPRPRLRLLAPLWPDAAVRPGACGKRRVGPGRVGPGRAGSGQHLPARPAAVPPSTHRRERRRVSPVGRRGAARPPAAGGGG